MFRVIQCVASSSPSSQTTCACACISNCIGIVIPIFFRASADVEADSEALFARYGRKAVPLGTIIVQIAKYRRYTIAITIIICIAHIGIYAEIEKNDHAVIM